MNITHYNQKTCAVWHAKDRLKTKEVFHGWTPPVASRAGRYSCPRNERGVPAIRSHLVGPHVLIVRQHADNFDGRSAGGPSVHILAICRMSGWFVPVAHAPGSLPRHQAARCLTPGATRG
jgi:hypothetical protein